MPLTRATAEGIILIRVQAILSESLGAAIIPPLGTPVTSPNAWMGWVVAAALDDCRFPPADPSNPTGAECGAVPDQQRAKFADCGEYHALSAALNQYLDVTASMGNVSASTSDVGKRLQQAVEFKAKQLKDRYGIGIFQPGAGTIAVGQVPPYIARPRIPQGQNWPPPGGGFGRGYGFGRGW